MGARHVFTYVRGKTVAESEGILTYTYHKSDDHSLLSRPWCDAGFPNFRRQFFFTRMCYGYFFRLWICFVFFIFLPKYRKCDRACGVCFSLWFITVKTMIGFMSGSLIAKGGICWYVFHDMFYFLTNHVILYVNCFIQVCRIRRNPDTVPCFGTIFRRVSSPMVFSPPTTCAEFSNLHYHPDQILKWNLVRESIRPVGRPLMEHCRDLAAPVQAIQLPSFLYWILLKLFFSIPCLSMVFTCPSV